MLAAGFGAFGSEIVVDFRAGAAGSGVAHLPEVVLFVEPEDAVLGDAGDALPQLFGFVVFAEDGDVEAVFGEAVVLGDQVPGEPDGIGFEVVAEGEVAQHLEEGVVAAGVADVFEVVVLAAGADAFLRGGGAGVVALLEPEEDFLELVHAGVGEQQRRVVGREQRRTAHDAMAVGLEEFEKALPYIVACHGSPLFRGYFYYMWGALANRCQVREVVAGEVEGLVVVDQAEADPVEPTAAAEDVLFDLRVGEEEDLGFELNAQDVDEDVVPVSVESAVGGRERCR